MKKKFFAVAMAATMALSTVMTASAATVSGGWWTAWTESYELTDTLEFDIDVKGGDAVWNNVAAVFTNAKITGNQLPADEVGESYKEYAVIRGDNWGWGGGNNMSIDGTPITYEGGVAELGDIDFIATMKDCHIDATITRNGNDITMVYQGTGANGKTFTRTAKFSADVSAGCYVFFVPDSAEVTVTPVIDVPEETTTEETTVEETTAEETTAEETTAEETTAEETTAKETTVNESSNNTETTTSKTDSPKTGESSAVAVLGVVAVMACAGVVVSRKKFNA